jgi:hypothetical protein
MDNWVLGREQLMIRKLIVLAIVSGLSFTSCGVSNTVDPTPDSSESNQTISSEEAKTKFMEISRASCDKAMTEGVVEQSTKPEGFTLVMVPKDDAYLDYSAAYFEPEDTYEIIWEVDAFSSCGASVSFDLADEAGVESDIAVAFNSTTGAFETTQDFGEFGVVHLSYNTTDGLISKVETLSSNEANPRTIRYGNLQEIDWIILRTAVDRFLESD